MTPIVLRCKYDFRVVYYTWEHFYNNIFLNKMSCEKEWNFEPHKIRTTIFLLWKVLQTANAIFFIMLLRADASASIAKNWCIRFYCGKSYALFSSSSIDAIWCICVYCWDWCISFHRRELMYQFLLMKSDASLPVTEESGAKVSIDESWWVSLCYWNLVHHILIFFCWNLVYCWKSTTVSLYESCSISFWCWNRINLFKWVKSNAYVSISESWCNCFSFTVESQTYTYSKNMDAPLFRIVWKLMRY